MKKGLALLFLTLCALSCPAQVSAPPPLPSWNDASQKAWWDQNGTPAQWPQAVTDLTAQLDASYKQSGDACYSDSDFQGWLEQLEWIKLGIDCASILNDDANLKAFIALGKDTTVSHLFVEKIKPANSKKDALLNLIRLSQANAADLHEYAALGVAYALVFDKPFPRNWPHSQVKQDAVPIGDLDVVQRFNFYVQSNRNQKLDQDLTQLTFDQLKFMVDTKVELSELEYGQQSRVTISHFADAFFSINYDTTRVGNGNFAVYWNLPTYTLKDIATNGGICVDQAYYAATLGKGRGIPTIFFTGQGAGGGHAWFGYLSRSGQWELDCGRYASQNYPKGYAVDPQTWQRIDDTTLANFFKNGDKDPHYQPAQNAIAWAVLHQNDPSCKKILDEARAIMPELSETWKMEGAYLAHTKASDDDQKSFYQDWIRQFSSYDEMKVEGQRHLLEVLKRTNDPDADSLQQDLVLANRSGGNFDVGIQSASESIQSKMKAGNWDDARLEYERAIRDFADEGGGTLFYSLILPYIQTCLKNGQVDLAAKAIDFTNERMSIDPTTILGEEFGQLKRKVEEQKKAGGGGDGVPIPGGP